MVFCLLKLNSQNKMFDKFKKNDSIVFIHKLYVVEYHSSYTIKECFITVQRTVKLYGCMYIHSNFTLSSSNMYWKKGQTRDLFDLSYLENCCFKYQSVLFCINHSTYTVSGLNCMVSVTIGLITKTVRDPKTVTRSKLTIVNPV